MFCTECGVKNTEESNFCRKCGTRLRVPRPPISDKAPHASALGPDSSPVDEEKVKRLLDRAFELYDSGHVDQAFEVCRAALRMNPDSVTGHSLLSSIYAKQGQLDAAIRQMERVVELNPESSADLSRLEALRRRQKLLTDDEPLRPQTRQTSYRQLILNNPPVLAATGTIAIVLLGVVAFGLKGKGTDYPALTPGPQASTQTTAAPGQSVAPSSVEPASPPTVSGSVFDGVGVNPTTQGATLAREAAEADQEAATSASSSAPSAERPPERRAPTPAAAPPAPATPPRPAPVSAPTPRISITRASPGPAPSQPSQTAPSQTPSGRDYQQRAMDAKASGDRAGAVENYRKAIAAYQSEAARSGNSMEAQQGLRSCKLALELMGEGQ